jgi:hypothetical protein
MTLLIGSAEALCQMDGCQPFMEPRLSGFLDEIRSVREGLGTVDGLGELQARGLAAS